MLLITQLIINSVFFSLIHILHILCTRFYVYGSVSGLSCIPLICLTTTVLFDSHGINTASVELVWLYLLVSKNSFFKIALTFFLTLHVNFRFSLSPMKMSFQFYWKLHEILDQFWEKAFLLHWDFQSLRFSKSFMLLSEMTHIYFRVRILHRLKRCCYCIWSLFSFAFP